MVAIAAALAVFAVDLVVPLGIAVGVLYVAVIVMGLGLPRSRHTWLLAALASLLTILALFVTERSSQIPPVFVHANRLLSLGAIWVTAAIVVAFRARIETYERERERVRLFLAQVIDAAPYGVLVVARDGTIRLANRAICETLGYERVEVADIGIEQLIPGGSALLQTDAAPSGDLAAPGPDHRLHALREDGRPIDVECVASSFLSGTNDEVAILAVRDVTERLRFEERVRATQRMEAIGKLAGGIAHDFNNLLMVVLGNANFVLDALPEDSPLREDMIEIAKVGDRAAELTRKLLAFSRRQIIEPCVVSPNQMVREMERMFSRILGEDIELSVVLAQDAWPVEIDPGAVEQVLMNLVVNAREAMPEGGVLTIETANITLDEAYAREHPEVVPGDFVVLAVSDTGTGMTEEVRARAFEPFFTTKPHGIGTGLGLASVYGIVKQAGGHIWLYSEPGRGTSVKIYLPRSRKATGSLPKRDEARRAKGGTETILVVEDEVSVRRTIVRSLREAGYQVIETTNGMDALAKVRALDGCIDLLLTDVIMPQMGGQELALRMRERFPELRILYMSGYTENAIVHHGVLEPDLVFLQKPFLPTTLLRRVREILDA
jgi:PAS domain S-box-containing protein